MNYHRRGNLISDSSLVAGLNAAVKIFCFLLVFVSVLLTGTVQGFAVMLLFIAAVVYLSGAELSEHMTKLRGLLGISIIILLLNTCFYMPQYAKITFWIFSPSIHGAIHGMALVLRMVMIVSLLEVFVSTTPDDRLCSAFALLLSPFAFLGIPVGQTAFILSSAISFIPRLIHETERVRFMQKARGVLHTGRNFFDKIADMKAILIPAFFAVLDQAQQLSDTIDARGGLPEKRLIKKKDKQLAFTDIYAVIVCVSVFVMQLVILR